jgi:UDP-glucose 4-epimerase
VTARVLVTGASGFVGRPLVRALSEGGVTVRAATRDAGTVDFPSGVEVVAVGDYGRPVDWRRALADVEAVVHLAGIAHIGNGVDAQAYDRVIRAATAELVAACGRAGVRRLVYMSSVRAQSGPAADKVLTEADVPCPTEAYGRAKLAAEAAVRAGAVDWTILRPTMIYGPGAKGNLASLQRLADTPWPLPLAGFTARRSLVSIDNVIGAVQFALAAPQASRQTFLVADPTPVTLAEIVTALRRGQGRPPRLYSVSPRAIEIALTAAGLGDVWQRLGGSLAVDPGKLIAAGWRPQGDTQGAFADMAAAEALARR